MKSEQFPLILKAKDFAKSFDDDINNFSSELYKKITDLDFRYRLPTQEENEQLILNMLLKIDSINK